MDNLTEQEQKQLMALINKGKKTLKYIYKGKVYINANNKSYIVLNEKGASKSYVFNLGTKKKTKQMYYELLEHAH